MGSIPTGGALEVWPWTFGSRTAWLVNKSAGQPQLMQEHDRVGSRSMATVGTYRWDRPLNARGRARVTAAIYLRGRDQTWSNGTKRDIAATTHRFNKGSIRDMLNSRLGVSIDNCQLFANGTATVAGKQ